MPDPPDRSDRIVIQDYDLAWPRLFEQQRGAVEQALGDHLARPVEHVGSTSVPDLPAKPIIDMLAVVHSCAAAGPGVTLLSERGWLLAPEPGDEAAGKYSVCYPEVQHRTHHLHVVEADRGWEDLLLFRDHLRAHPTGAREYADLKRRLAAVDDWDRPRYRAAKAPFIASTLDAARRRLPASPTST